MSDRTCSVDRCERSSRKRGWCDMHYVRWRRHGDPDRVLPVLEGAANPQWKGDDIGYPGVHHRIRRTRGNARNFACVMCGGRARDWAYDHCDPNELQVPADAERFAGMPYSLDLEHYQPMCKACHNQFDKTD